MRKLILLMLFVAAAASLNAQTRRRTVQHPSLLSAQAPAPVLYRGDAGRTGVTSLTGPVFLETERWARPLQGPVYGLVFDRSVVYAGGFGALTAVDAATGADLWVFAQPGAQFSPVAIVGDEVYVAGGSVFYALNRTTGAQLWSANAGADISRTAPLLVDGIAYVGSSAGTVHAIKLSTHAQLWSRNIGSPVRAELASAKNVLVVLTDAGLKGLKIQDGVERWSLAGAWSNPAVDSKNVYSGLPGAFHAVDLNTGHIEWTFTAAGLTQWGGAAVTNGLVTVGNAGTANGTFYFLNADDGTLPSPLANFPMDQQKVNTPPIVGTGNMLYFGLGNDPLAPFGPNFGVYTADLTLFSERSIRIIYGHVTGGVAIGDGAEYVHDSTNTLSAFAD